MLQNNWCPCPYVGRPSHSWLSSGDAYSKWVLLESNSNEFIRNATPLVGLWSRSDWFYSWLRFMSIQQNSAFISCFFRWVACGGAALLPEEDAEAHRYIEISRKWTRTRTEWCSAHSCVSQDPVRSVCAETGCSDLVSNARLIKLPVLTHPGWMQWWRVGYGYSYPVMIWIDQLRSGLGQIHTGPHQTFVSSCIQSVTSCFLLCSGGNLAPRRSHCQEKSGTRQEVVLLRWIIQGWHQKSERTL